MVRIGQVRVYDVLGVEVPKSCHLGAATGSAANPTVLKLLECHIWGDGLAAVSWDMQVYVAEGLGVAGGTPKLFKLKTSLSAERPYTAMTVIPARLSTSNHLEVSSSYLIELYSSIDIYI